MNNIKIIGYLVYYKDINIFLKTVKTAADFKAKRKILTQSLGNLLYKTIQIWYNKQLIKKYKNVFKLDLAN